MYSKVKVLFATLLLLAPALIGGQVVNRGPGNENRGRAGDPGKIDHSSLIPYATPLFAAVPTTGWQNDTSGAGVWSITLQGELTDSGNNQIYVLHFLTPMDNMAGSAIALYGAGANASTDYNGIMFHVDCGTAAATTTGRALYVRGSGTITLADMTGSTITNADNGGDFGAAVGAGDYIGVQWSGTGRTLVTKVWNIQSGSEPAGFDPADSSTWGTCASSIYDSVGGGASPSCSANNTDAVISASGFDDGKCVGLYHRDTAGNGNAGPLGFWINDE
jgi:hypothetical protein